MLPQDHTMGAERKKNSGEKQKTKQKMNKKNNGENYGYKKSV